MSRAIQTNYIYKHSVDTVEKAVQDLYDNDEKIVCVIPLQIDLKTGTIEKFAIMTEVEY